MRITRLSLVFLISIATPLILIGALSSAGKGSGQASSFLASTPTGLEGDGPWVVRAYFSERSMVEKLAAWNEPWEVHHDQGFLVTEVNRDQYRRMEQLGFRLEVDAGLTERLTRPATYLREQEAGVPGYPCYRTVEETYASAAGLTAAYPKLANWIKIGSTWEQITPGGQPGYDLQVLRLGNTLYTAEKPRLFIMASMHAREYAPAELALRFAERLLELYGQDPNSTWLLDHHEIHLLLQANPDGRKKAESGLSWRKNTNGYGCIDFYSIGVDLNRNYSFGWGGAGSSTDTCDLTYRGLAPASEPETQAVENYLRANFADHRQAALDSPASATTPGIFIDLHSYGDLVLWPWGFTYDPPPNAAALQTLGRKLAYFNQAFPAQSIDLYPTSGTTDDFAYGELGLAAFTIEVGNSFFQDCPTFENSIWPRNWPALLYAAAAARTPYLSPSGPDSRDISTPSSKFMLGDTLHVTAYIDHTRYSSLGGYEIAQAIAGAEIYLDTPPWITATLPISYSMTAVDGSYDSSIEAVEAFLDTSTLIPGRHTLFIRGRDTAGNWGVVSAALFDIEPAGRRKIYFPLITMGWRILNP